MPGLIEGLPDDVAIRCLARVPFLHHPTLSLVSRSWKEALSSTQLFLARNELKSTERFIAVCSYDPNNLWQLYDPLLDLWASLPALPSPTRHLAHFRSASVSGKLFVLGGGSDAVDPATGDSDGLFATDEVWSYQPVSRRWARCRPMTLPRALFACCVLEGKIVVAGGFTDCRSSTSEAEIYDQEKDSWAPIPDLFHKHDSACEGVVVGGRVHVLHKGLSTMQVLESVVERGWSVWECGWVRGPMAVVKGEVYVMSNGNIYKQGRGSSKVIVSSASEFRRRIEFAMIGLGEEIYVIGGVIGPDMMNWDVKWTSDVYALALGSNERSVWRQVAPMTRCRGPVLGCTELEI